MTTKAQALFAEAELTEDDLASIWRSDRQAAENPLLGSEVARSLAIGRLSEGVRRSGRWARQLRLGTLSILFLRHDPVELQGIREQERCANRLRLSLSRSGAVSWRVLPGWCARPGSL